VPQISFVGPSVRSAGLLVGRTHLSGTAMSLVGGDPDVGDSHRGPLNNRGKPIFFRK
jgi:hypothetical protein